MALVGQNGAGKTTIVKLITRLYDPDEGQILIDGVDIREYDLQSLHDAIGVIFQDYVTYFFSAGDNIGVGRLAEMQNREMVETSASKSGADRVISKLPRGTTPPWAAGSTRATSFRAASGRRWRSPVPSCATLIY